MPLVVEIVYFVGWVLGEPLHLGVSIATAFILFPISLPTLVVGAILTFMLRRSPGASRTMARIGLSLMLFYLLAALVFGAFGYRPLDG
jgi:ABC-type sulfate transport system permease component